ncbi:hypothetical protein [Vibrio gangliei]|uniref:hypothetical protein n=1 Tax=Vibrio gangliei TaxID=2077090 RepID=UPI000D02123F|nr:hypothetical protein [Vibrio gangliei]
MRKLLSKKLILAALTERYELSVGDVELIKFDGEYHWAGRVGACFADTLAVTGNLSTWPLERWLEDFNFKSEKLLADKGASLKAYIDSIDWNVEYE